jgi:hypothetical protein
MPRSADRHEYFVYDGRACIGRFTLDDDTGDAKAFDANGKPLGKFAGFKAGAAAVSEAQRVAAIPVKRATKRARKPAGRLAAHA